VDVEVAFSGIRPGEKLFEELSSEGEHIGDTAHPKIGIWKHRPEDWEAVHRGIDRLIQIADTASEPELQGEMKRLVPEYVPSENEETPAGQKVPTATPSA
jgi:FlaA1/EpsC-like NDP-sugar epimerase